MEDFYSGLLSVPIVPTAPKKKTAPIGAPQPRVVKKTILKPLVRARIPCKEEPQEDEPMGSHGPNTPQKEDEVYWNTNPAQHGMTESEESANEEYYWNRNPIPNLKRLDQPGVKVLQTEAKPKGMPCPPPIWFH